MGWDNGVPRPPTMVGVLHGDQANCMGTPENVFLVDVQESEKYYRELSKNCAVLIAFRIKETCPVCQESSRRIDHSGADRTP